MGTLVLPSRVVFIHMRSAKSLALARLSLAVLVLSCSVLPLSAQEGEKKEGREAEPDKPMQRALYLEEMRTGGKPQPPAARIKALRERDEAIREEGVKFRQKMETSQASREEAIAGVSANPSSWINIGPRPTTTPFSSGNSSGRVAAIAVDPNDATGNTVYVGAAQGGVWKTTNGGSSWTPLTDSQPSLAVGSIAIASDGTIYVGTGEQSFSSDSYYGAGVLKSTDGGNSWTQMGASTFAADGCQSVLLSCGGHRIGGIAVRPGTSGGTQEIIAATQGSFSNTGGLFRSTNGGTTWTKVAPSSGSTHTATSVAFASSSVAYAGIFSQGVFKSVNGGATWVAANGTGTVIDTTNSERVELAVFNENIVYAAIADASDGLHGLYKTTDGGGNWTKLTITDFCSPQCWYDMVVSVNPAVANGDVVYVGGAAGDSGGYIQKSTNGGGSWTTTTTGVHVDQHAHAFSANGAKLYIGNDGGVWSTTDTGTGTATSNWSNLNSDLSITQFYTYFSIHPTNIDITFGGTQDNGTQRYTGTNPLATAWSNVTCGDGAGAFVDPAGPIYANCQNTDIRRSTTGGGSGTFSTFETGLSQSDSPNFIPPMAGDPNNPTRVYWGATSIWRNFNDGSNWQAIAGTALSGEQWNNFAFASNGDLYAVSDLNATVMHVAVPSMTVTNITGSGGPAIRLNGVAVAPDNGTVYVAAAGFNSSNKVYRAVPNGGSTVWTNITGTGLPNTPVNDLVADQEVANTLYAATDVGVYRTQNANVASPTWSLLGTGMPNVAVFGLKLHQSSRTLRAATHGRGFWDLSVPTSVVGPGLFVSPTTVTFSLQGTGTTSAAQVITLTNNGNQTTTLSSITVSNNPSEYAMVSTCGGTLAVGAQCTLSVTFTPTAAGTRNGTITIQSNATPNTLNISLTGTALLRPANDDFAAAQVLTGTFSQSGIDTRGATKQTSDPTPSQVCVGGVDGFGPFFTNNNTIWYKFTPTSSGTMSLDTIGADYDTVLTVWTQNASTRRMQLVQAYCSDDIVPAQNQDSQLANVAVTAGNTYYIMASSYDPGGGTMTFNFSTSLSGVAAAITISPSPVNISAVTGQTMGTVTVTYSNPTGSSVTVSNVSVNNGFSILSNGCGVVASGGSCAVVLSRSGTVNGNASGTLTFTDNAAGSPRNIAVNLTATNFTLTGGRSIRPLRSGSSASREESFAATLSVAEGGDAGQAISLDCEGAPAGSSCSVEPARVAFAGGSTPVTVSVRSANRASRLSGNASYTLRVNAKLGDTVRTLDIPVRAGNASAAPVVKTRGPRGIQQR